MPKAGFIPTIHAKLHNPKAKETAIYFQLQKEGVKYKVFPGEKIMPSDWDKKRQRAKTGMNQRQYLDLNDRLNEWEKVIRRTWEENAVEGFTPEVFRQLVFEAKQGGKSLSLISWMQEYTKDYAKALQKIDDLGEGKKAVLFAFLKEANSHPHIFRAAKGENVEYVPLLTFAQRFIDDRIKSDKYNNASVSTKENAFRALCAYSHLFGPVDYNEINWQWLESFTEFCYSEYEFDMQYRGKKIKFRKRQYEQNYASKIVAVIKQFVTEARKKRLTDNTIVSETGFSLPTNDTNAAMMYFEDIKLLSDTNITSTRMQNTRNLAIRAFCTGLRFSDWHKIGPENIYTVNGKRVLEVHAQKTGKPVTIPMLPLLERILKEPKPKQITNAVFNINFRELCESVGLTREITWTSYAGGMQTITTQRLCDKVSAHDLRRSALTNFVLMNLQGIANMPDGLVRLISGHSSDAMFRKYIRIGDRLKAANMSEEFIREKKEFLLS